MARAPFPPVIDMTPDGRFRDPAPGARPPRVGVLTRLGAYSVVIAVIAGGMAIMALMLWLALWLAMALLPIALGATLVGFVIVRFQLWRARRSLGGQSLRFRR
jgi:hypothetical protein